MRHAPMPAARACSIQAERDISRMAAEKTRAGHAHPDSPINAKVSRIDGSGSVLSGRMERSVMKRNIHGNERQIVVKPDMTSLARRTRRAAIDESNRATPMETRAAAG